MSSLYIPVKRLYNTFDLSKTAGKDKYGRDLVFTKHGTPYNRTWRRSKELGRVRNNRRTTLGRPNYQTHLGSINKVPKLVLSR